MRILIFTPVFFPSVGGMETITDALAREYVAQGHEVKLVTFQPLKPTDPDATYPYPVYRNPTSLELFRYVKWCDVYYHNGASIKMAWPLLFLRRPWVNEYMLWRFGTPGKPLNFRNRILTTILKHTAWHMGQSNALVRYLPFPSFYVPTPFRSGLLRVIPDVSRDRDIVFAGRLIREKGVQTLLHALSILKSRGQIYNATIVGTGSEAAEFRALSTQLGLDDQVTFTGVKLGEDFAREINRHDVMVVPSIWDEPFGTVAAEGIACGCVVIAADSGGLPDTVGPCGLIVPRDNPQALADKLSQLLQNRPGLAAFRAPAQQHLAQFHIDASARIRLNIFRQALKLPIQT